MFKLVQLTKRYGKIHYVFAGQWTGKKFDIMYIDAGKFPIPDEVFEEDINNLISILRQVK